MDFKRILQSFNNPKFKFGGYAALISVIVVALLVALNILVDQIPGAKADLTEEGLFTLSEQTITVLEDLDTDVTIYSLFETGKEIDEVEEILDKYKLITKRIVTTNIDPYRNPGFLSKYKDEDREPGANSLIVETGDDFRLISQYDFYNYSQPQGGDPFGPRRRQSIKIEQKLTGAIMALTADKLPAIYVLQGHEERALPFEIRQQLEAENYTVEDLNLLVEGKVPDDADILLVIGPRRDMTPQEEGLIREFLLERRKNALFLFDLQVEGTEFPNFDSILRSYGVEIRPILVIERDANQHVPQNPLALVPEMSFHPVTNTLRANDLPVLWPRTQAVRELDVKRRTIEMEPVLTTSEKAWGKVDLDNDSTEQTLADPSGPFDLVMAITDEGEREAEDSRVLVAGSSFVLYPERALGLPLVGPGNADFILNSFNWLQGQEELISIRPKSLIQFPLRMNQLQFFGYAGLTILIPIAIVVAGVIIWLRRRHL